MMIPKLAQFRGAHAPGTYLTSWLLSWNKGECVDAAEVKFSPETAVAFRRSVLGFPGLCAIASCCVGEQCSDFLTMTGPTVSCYIPALELGDELGIYNISVIFPNGSRSFAKHPLLLGPPSTRGKSIPYPEVRRYSLSPNPISGVFFNWTRELSLIVPWPFSLASMLDVPKSPRFRSWETGFRRLNVPHFFHGHIEIVRICGGFSVSLGTTPFTKSVRFQFLQRVTRGRLSTRILDSSLGSSARYDFCWIIPEATKATVAVLSPTQ